MKTATETKDAKVIRFDADDTFTFSFGSTVHTVTREAGYAYGRDHHNLTCSCGEDLGRAERDGIYVTTQTELVTHHAQSLIHRDILAARSAAQRRVIEEVITRVEAGDRFVTFLVNEANDAIRLFQRTLDDLREARERGRSDSYYERVVDSRSAVRDHALESLYRFVAGPDAPVLAGGEFSDALTEAGVLVSRQEVAA